VTTGAFSAQGMVRAARAIAPLVLFVVLPFVIALAQWSDLSGRFDTHGFDFRGTLWEPARAVLDGSSPYPDPEDPSVVTGNPSVYPPLAIIVSVALARIDFDAAYLVWSIVLLVATAGALRLVGVRDWRCYSLALLSPPVVYGIFFGNITLLLLLPLALAWRWRDRAVGAGLAVAILVAVKPFLLLLTAWLLLTHRLRAALVALIGATALIVLPWAGIGFDGFRIYPRLVDRVESAYGPGTDSLPAALSWFASGHAARQVMCGLAAIALVALAVRARQAPDGDVRVFAILVGACVVATPMVWPHYVALLFVPLAIARPRVDVTWFLPYALCPILAIDDRVLRAWMFLLVPLAMIAVSTTKGRRHRLDSTTGWSRCIRPSAP
jgi:hypothetical protein